MNVKSISPLKNFSFMSSIAAEENPDPTSMTRFGLKRRIIE